MSKKPIKDWGAVKFLTKKLPDVAGDVLGGITDVLLGESPVKVVRDRILGEVKQRKDLTPEDIEMVELQLDQALEMARIQNQEAQSARTAEMDRYKMADNAVSKNMNTIIALTIVIGYFGLVGALMFISEIGVSNQRLIDVAFGAIGASLVQIINHYFGRSKREDEKDAKHEYRF